MWPLERLRPHPDEALVPAMDARQYRSFRADIKRRGILEPLQATPAGVLLDGRSRLRAAEELGIEAVPVQIIVPESEREHMLLCALRRSHLRPSQLAALVVELQQIKLEQQQASERQRANLRGAAEVATLPPRGERTREIAARLAGVSPRIVQDAFTVRDADAELFRAVKEGRISVDKAARRVRQAERDARLAREPVMPEGPFDLIYADPPWQLGGDPGSAYAPENHYPTMAAAEIKALVLPAAENAVLFLWSTCGVLPQALELMAAWGFVYCSQQVWVKPSPGLGNWVRYQHELLLIGRRGDYHAPEPELRPSSLIEAPRGRHSQKPELVYELLERMYPEASKLELFARRPRPGWAAFGNELAA